MTVSVGSPNYAQKVKRKKEIGKEVQLLLRCQASASSSS